MPPTCLPPAFVARLRLELGPSEAEAILATMREGKDCAYWLNPLRSGDAPAFGRAVPGVPGVYMCDGSLRDSLVHHEAAATGRIYVLNPASAVAVQALAPRPGELVLDLASAPGGKAILMAAQMENRGTILAMDASRPRFHRLQANLTRCGVTIADCRWRDGRELGPSFNERFDRVLLDAPCASEARFRADEPASWRHWSPRKVREAAHKQRGLLRAAFRCLKPGGVLVYATCSYSLRENERTVAYLLRREASARLLPLTPADFPNGTPGTLPGTLRIRPDALFDGMFLARLTKLLGRDVVG